ncbi:MAG: amino acid permease [Bacteroidetes bacterium]|jgi:APA family basic amino acid/polyamine antiporter|nr:amino acid permease [Bacteroidota bacterium]
MADQQNDRPKLERVLGLREGISIHMGVIIGSGIFIVPATIAGHLGAMGPIILVWSLAGMLTLFGALTLAELSSVLPQSGGPYVYLRESFGKLYGFLFSWNDFFINKAGSAAAIAVAFATYLGTFVPVLDPRHRYLHTEFDLLGVPFDVGFGPVQLAAILVVALVTFVNVRGVRFGAWVMNIFTSAKVLALIGLIVAAVLYANGSTANYLPWWPETWNADYTAAFGLAMISALWAYDGWIDVTITAGEYKDPSRTIPRALLYGTLAVIALYITANLAFAYVIPIGTMAGSPRIAADVANVVLGPVGASLIIVGIIASTFGTTNGMLLVGPRSIHAAGEDGVMPRRLGVVHPRYHTPANAIVTLGIWSAILTLSGTYEQITSYVVFGSWGLYALTAVSVIVLRKKMPDAPRPYKAWGYPYATLVFVGLAGWFVYNTLVEDTRNAVIGIVLLLVSLPIYYRMTSKRS